MAKYLYLLFNCIVAVPVLILSVKSDVKIHSNWRALLWVFGCVSVPFTLWDIWAAKNGHWLFNDRYITGITILTLPIEEILFFLSVPFAMLYVWGVVQKHVKDRPLGRSVIDGCLVLVSGIAVTLLVSNWGKGYTRSVLPAVLATNLLLVTNRLRLSSRFWVFQLYHLVLFVVCNTFLTALPIIEYGQGSIIGVRFGTVPVEDFTFSFALNTTSLLIWGTLQYHNEANKRA